MLNVLHKNKGKRLLVRGILYSIFLSYFTGQVWASTRAELEDRIRREREQLALVEAGKSSIVVDDTQTLGPPARRSLYLGTIQQLPAAQVYGKFGSLTQLIYLAMGRAAQQGVEAAEEALIQYDQAAESDRRQREIEAENRALMIELREVREQMRGVTAGTLDSSFSGDDASVNSSPARDDELRRTKKLREQAALLKRRLQRFKDARRPATTHEEGSDSESDAAEALDADETHYQVEVERLTHQIAILQPEMEQLKRELAEARERMALLQTEHAEVLARETHSAQERVSEANERVRVLQSKTELMEQQLKELKAAKEDAEIRLRVAVQNRSEAQEKIEEFEVLMARIRGAGCGQPTEDSDMGWVSHVIEQARLSVTLTEELERARASLRDSEAQLERQTSETGGLREVFRSIAAAVGLAEDVDQSVLSVRVQTLRADVQRLEEGVRQMNQASIALRQKMTGILGVADVDNDEALVQALTTVFAARVPRTALQQQVEEMTRLQQALGRAEADQRVLSAVLARYGLSLEGLPIDHENRVARITTAIEDRVRQEMPRSPVRPYQTSAVDTAGSVNHMGRDEPSLHTPLVKQADDDDTPCCICFGIRCC